MDILWLIATACFVGAVWILMTRLKTALARDSFQGLAVTKVISSAVVALAGGIMFITLRSASRIFLLAFVATVLAMITASAASRLLQRVERQDSLTVRAYMRYRCASTWHETSSKTKRFFMLAAPDGWREVRITAKAFDSADSVPVMLRIMGLMYVIILVFAFVVSFVSITGMSNEIQSGVVSTAVSYNMLALSCLFTASALICLVVVLILRWCNVLSWPPGVGSYVRCVSTWIGYGGTVGAVMASLVPLAGLAFPSLFGPAESASALTAITPRSMLEYPAAGAVAGYAFGLIVASASLFPGVKNSWIRRALCPGLFVVVLLALSREVGGPRGLLRPVIDAAAQRSGFNDAWCTSPAPSDIGTGSLDATAWFITAMERCGDGLLVSTMDICWIVGIAALLVWVSLFVVDIRVRARSGDQQSG